MATAKRVVTNMSKKYIIKEKEYNYQDRSRANQTGSKFFVFNRRTNRNMGRFDTRAEAQGYLDKLNGNKSKK